MTIQPITSHANPPITSAPQATQKHSPTTQKAHSVAVQSDESVFLLACSDGESVPVLRRAISNYANTALGSFHWDCIHQRLYKTIDLTAPYPQATVALLAKLLEGISPNLILKATVAELLDLMVVTHNLCLHTIHVQAKTELMHRLSSFPSSLEALTYCYETKPDYLPAWKDMFSTLWTCAIVYASENELRATSLHHRLLDILREHTDSFSQVMLGRCYQHGLLGLKPDIQKAIELWLPFAREDDAMAQCSLAECYRHGQGVARDFSQAFGLWQSAARQGLSDAEAYCGICHERGIGTPQDLRLAIKWYEKASLQGHPLAMKRLKYYCSASKVQSKL